MTKLSCKVSPELGAEITAIGIDMDIKKGKTLDYLVKLAVDNATFEKETYGTGETVSCTLQMSEKKYTASKPYRLLHGLETKVAFLKDALERGVSIHRSHNPK
ncbi:MAG: hypothetical protein AAFQ55_06815 [Pseudomonadota bacterium]